MISILLTILKVIGITLLCLLILALLLVLIVLFCPIRYEMEGVIPEDPAASAGKLRVSWLLHLVEGSYTWPAGPEGAMHLRVAFFTLIPRRERRARRTKENDRPHGDSQTEEEPVGTGEALYKEEGWAEIREEEDRPQDTENTPETGTVDRPEADAEDQPEAEDQPGAEDQSEAADSREHENDSKEEPSDAEDTGRKKRRSPAEVMEELAKKPQLAARKIYYTISGTCDKIKMVRATTESMTWLRAKQLLLNETGRVLRHTRPRKCRMEVTYGSSSPEVTGDVCAAVGILTPFFEDRLRFTPVFEDRDVFFGQGNIKGRVILAIPVWSFLRCFFNRDVRRLYRRVQKIRNHEKGGERKDG